MRTHSKHSELKKMGLLDLPCRGEDHYSLYCNYIPRQNVCDNTFCKITLHLFKIYKDEAGLQRIGEVENKYRAAVQPPSIQFPQTGALKVFYRRTFTYLRITYGCPNSATTVSIRRVAMCVSVGQ